MASALMRGIHPPDNNELKMHQIWDTDATKKSR
jgi:hypothetical protein